jgi:MFS family permease
VAASAAYAVQGLCFAGVVTQIPVLQDKFGLSEMELLPVLLMVPLIAGVGSVLAGRLAPRLSSATVLRVAALGVNVGVALVGLAPSLALLFPAVAVFGLAVGGVDATMNMQGVAVQARYGRTILNSFHAWWSVAGIAAALAVSGMAGLDWPLVASMGAIAGVGAVVALVAGPSLLAEDRGQAAATPAVVASVRIPWLPVVLVGVAVMVMYIAESSVSNWAGVYLQDGLSAAKTVVPLGLAAYLSFQLLGRMLADRVVGRLGVVATVMAGGVLGAIGFGLTAVAPSPLWAIVGLAAVGAGLCVVVPMAFSAAGGLDPTGSGVVIARVNLFNYAGFVVGTGLIGVIAEGAGLRFAFAVPGALALAIVPLALAFRPAEASRAVGFGAGSGDEARPARAIAAE